MPAEGPLPAAYRELGLDVTYTVWPGYAGMMAEPHEAVLEPDTLTSITNWLCAAHPLDAHAAHKSALPRVLPEWPDGFSADGVRESLVPFGADGSLVGVLAEPAGPNALKAQAETAVLMLNVGGNYRIGPNRVYVKAARELAGAGYRVFRLDVAGIGDSRTETGFSSASMYRQDSVDDVRAAIDALAERGCRRFYVMGICSGSYLAFETALRDARVTGEILLNSRLLEWDARKSGPWQSSMQEYYKSTRYYRQALLRANVYSRLVRGRINVRVIAQRLWTLTQARVKRAAIRLLRLGPPDEGVLAKFKHLSARDTDTLLIMSAQDDGLDYIEYHVGPDGARLKNDKNFHMMLIEDADHTFSTEACQHAMIAAVREHLDAAHARPAAQNSLQTRIATT
jgi:pimeloyl-ACP methyl ester carboxylesterase